jgi:enoyl-CoA hydratase/3-hydroxyacyl-CoA dehydrogenase
LRVGLGDAVLRRFVVVGAGTMGHGIAQLLVMAGFEVQLVDINDEILKKALDKIGWSLNKLAEKRRIKEEDVSVIKSKIKPTTSLEEAAKDSDFAIEATPENLELKKRVFSALDKTMPKHAILATNTSSLSISEIAKATERPDKVVGMHFFNPPVLMELVEVIKGNLTSDETANATLELAKKLGKKPVLVRKDVRGFIVNRILLSMFNDACWAIHRGEATMEEVDATIKYKAGFLMGAFELADYLGLDVAYSVSKVIEEAYGDRAKTCPLLERLVKEGKLGQKTNAGFYDWTVGRPRIRFQLAGKFDVQRVYSIAANEAAWLIHEGVAEPSDIDMAMKLGTAWPSGPCELADRVGIDIVASKLKELYAKHKAEMYKPCPLLEEYISKGWLGRKSGRGFYSYG